jgi:segregation and condensation protein A
VSTPFTIRLERVFQGPLDLLLHLVREQEVEIHEIEINTVVQGYLDYLKALKDLDIELAGDFLVMAATLMSIKSRSLLPREEIDLEQELDPRDELIQRLIEYRRFKEASDQLGQRYALRELAYERGDAGAEAPAEEPVLELGELTSWDLLAAFSRLMRETLGHRPHRIQRESRPLRYYVQELAARMRARGSLSLREVVLGLDEEPSRESLVGAFCALLELVKLGLVGVTQPERNGEIRIELKPEHAGDIEGLIQSSVFDDEAPPPAPVEAPAGSAEA